jgi:hypothetical protein
MKINNARIETKRSVQMADRLWKKRMRKDIGFKLFVKWKGDSKTLDVELLPK